MINRKKIYRAISALLISGSLFIMPYASAEVYNADGEYTASKYEMLENAEQRAINNAMRHAQEQIKIYIENYSREKNLKLLDDEVIAIAENVLKFVENPTIKKDSLEDGSIKISAAVKIEIDDADLEKYFKKSLSNRLQIKSRFESFRKSNEEQEKRIKELEKQIAAGISTAQQEEYIKSQFANEDKIFLSNKKVNEGWKMYSQGDYKKVFEIFDEAVNLNPNNAEAYAGRGTTYDDLKQYDAAIADYNKAIELGLNSSWIYNNRGVSYMEGLKQYEKALADYNKAIEIDQNNVFAYSNIGFVYQELKQYDAAIAEYSKAIEIDPNYPLDYNERGIIYYDLKQYDKAIADFNKVIEIDPNDISALNNRGLVYHDLKQYDAAIADYSKAIEINPNEAMSYNNLGWLYVEMKDYSKAIIECNKAVELAPNVSNFYDSRGWAYLGLKDYENAVKDFNKALELDPKMSYSYQGRGKCYQEMGETEKASADFAKAKELGYTE